MVEPLSVAVHAVGRTPVKLNDAAVVIGTGMIGLLVVQALRAAGCGRIFAVDLDQAKLDLACRLGADVGLRSGEVDVSGQVRQQTGGRGADLAFEVVGTTATLQLAATCLRKGGHLTLVGNVSPNVEFPLQTIVTREITVAGSCASAGEYPACLDMIGRGTVRVDPLISAVVPLTEGPAWLQRLRNKAGGLMKVILTP
jgi:L-iditol 2-dehydrogenase